jgi:hypothetical protein
MVPVIDKGFQDSFCVECVSQGHDNWVRDLAFHANSSMLISSSDDRYDSVCACVFCLCIMMCCIRVCVNIYIYIYIYIYRQNL